jgi:branched-chain amino acid transport system substrate-binding protein
MFTNLGTKKIAIIAENDAYSTVLASGTNTYALNKGLNVVSYQVVPAGATDIATELQIAKAKEAEVLFICGHYAISFLTIKQLKELNINFNGVWLAIGPESPDFRKDLGKDCLYVCSLGSWIPDMEWQSEVTGITAKKFTALFRERFGHDPDYHAAVGAAAVECFVWAFQHARDLTPDSVRDALASIHGLKTVYMTIDFDERGAQTVPFYVTQIVGPDINDYRFVWPPEIAQATPVYPMPPWSQR